VTGTPERVKQLNGSLLLACQSVIVRGEDSFVLSAGEGPNLEPFDRFRDMGAECCERLCERSRIGA